LDDILCAMPRGVVVMVSLRVVVQVMQVRFLRRLGLRLGVHVGGGMLEEVRAEGFCHDIVVAVSNGV
jgi:hypothetical protein